MVDKRVDAVGVEGRLTHKQLEQNHPQGPEVRGIVVGLLFHEFRGHVERGSFDGGEYNGVRGHGPREAEVTKLDLTVRPDKNVLRLRESRTIHNQVEFHLHISMDDTIGVEIL